MEENTKSENQEVLKKDQDTSGNADEKNKAPQVSKPEEITEKYSAEEALTQEQASAYNAKITGAAKAQGNTLTAEEAASYNAKLEGAVKEGDSKSAKTPAEPVVQKP